MKEGFTLVNGGQYGLIYECSDGRLLKQTLWDDDIYGQRLDQYRPEHAQYITPTILSGYEHVLCPTGVQVVEEDGVYYYMKNASGGSLYDFFRYEQSSVSHLMKPLLFQVIFTLASIHTTWPTFRHNDLSLKNVVFERRYAEDHVKEYRAPNGSIFRVPTFGYHIYMIDFDMSSMPPVVFNYRVFHFYMLQPALGISHEQDQRFDMVRFVQLLMRTNRLTPQFVAELASVLPGIRPTSKHPRPNELSAFGTATDVLHGLLFREYCTMEAPLDGANQRPKFDTNFVTIKPTCLYADYEAVLCHPLASAAITAGNAFIARYRLADQRQWLLVYVAALVDVIYKSDNWADCRSGQQWVDKIAHDKLFEDDIIRAIIEWEISKI
jgi:serine/threonine protein kinase